MTWAYIGVAAVTAVAQDINDPGSIQGGAPPAFGGSSGGGGGSSLLSQQSDSGGYGELAGLLGKLALSGNDSKGGVTDALAQQPPPISSAPVNPLGTNDAVNALPGVDSDILADVSKKKGIAGQLDKFLEGPGRYGLLGMLMGGQ